MTLIKLDSGDYINLDVVEVIAEKYVSFIGDGLTYITPTERNRIVEAMTPSRPDYGIKTDSNGREYQVMTGTELISGLTDDAIRDEPLTASYIGIGNIVPGAKYRVLIEDGSLSNEWWKL